MDQPTRNATQRNGCLSFCCVLLRVCWSVCLSLSLSPYNKILLRDHHRDKPKAHPLAGQRARRLLCLCLFVCRAFVCVCVVFVFCVSPSNSAPYPPKQVELFLVVCVCLPRICFFCFGWFPCCTFHSTCNASRFFCLFVCLCECVCARLCFAHTPHLVAFCLFVCLFVVFVFDPPCDFSAYATNCVPIRKKTGTPVGFLGVCCLCFYSQIHAAGRGEPSSFVCLLLVSLCFPFLLRIQAMMSASLIGVVCVCVCVAVCVVVSVLCFEMQHTNHNKEVGTHIHTHTHARVCFFVWFVWFVCCLQVLGNAHKQQQQNNQQPTATSLTNTTHITHAQTPPIVWVGGIGCLFVFAPCFFVCVCVVCVCCLSTFCVCV